MSDGSLTGFTIAVTADRRSDEQISLLQRRGATTLHCPTIATAPLAAGTLAGASPLQAATEAAIAAQPDYVVFTTGMGARLWLAAAETFGAGDALRAMWQQARVLARGPKAAAALRSFEVTPWRLAEHETAAELIAILEAEPEPARTVVVQAHGHDDGRFGAALTPRGTTVIEVPVYRWNLPADLSGVRALVEQIVARRVDAVTFTAAPAVRNLVAVAETIGREAEMLAAFNEAAGVIAACVGPVCAAGAREVGFDRPIAPDVGRLGLLVRVLGEALAGR